MVDVVNPFLMLAGIGMMAVAVIAVVWWNRKTCVSWKWFGFGALVWIAAIALKLAMDFTITGSITGASFDAFGLLGATAVAAIYVGLRTGFLESGLSYLFGKKKAGKSRISFNEAIAFGIGFGAVEAFLLGLGSFLNILAICMYPQLLDSLDMVSKDMLLSSLGQNTLVVVPAVIERVAAIFIHTFAAVLVFASVNTKKSKYIWGSVAYKSVTDGIVPLLPLLAGAGIISSFAMEVPFVVLAAIGYFGIMDMRKLFS